MCPIEIYNSLQCSGVLFGRLHWREEMIDKAIAVYSIVEDILKAIGHREDKRRFMSDAEVITTGIVSALFFCGNIEKARAFMYDTGLIHNMLSKSRFCRRLHAVSDLIYDIFHQLGMALKMIDISTEYLIDSFPVPICDNIRISRSRIVDSEEFRGYIPSKKRYFYGVRVHVLTTSDGIPVEFAFLPGGANDVRGLGVLYLDLPPESEVYGDKAYTDYTVEDALKTFDNVNFDPIRKKNSTRYDEPLVRQYKKMIRKRIETTFSLISSFFPKWIHAVTLRGFLIKISLFIFAFTLDRAFL